jgi:hypothetical protein
MLTSATAGTAGAAKHRGSTSLTMLQVHTQLFALESTAPATAEARPM